MTTTDQFWQPYAGVDAARRRAAMLRQARDYFAQRGVLEIDTPILSETTVTDPAIESISTRLASSPGTPFYLQTSPEFHMKRLLAAGFPDLYEIGKVFRDAELGRRHQPEFTMVEWYRLGFDLNDIIEETVEFVAALIGTSRLSAAPERMTYRDAFACCVDIDPMASSVSEIAGFLQLDKELELSLGDSIDAGLDLVMATRVAAQFATDRLTVVYHYPASQAALARICPGDSLVADRFEVFCGPLELANGYVELTDVDEQRRRCEKDQESRESTNAVVVPIDEKFMAAVNSGLPSCAGVAVGFDRLLMIRAGVDEIRQVLHFPIES